MIRITNRFFIKQVSFSLRLLANHRFRVRRSTLLTSFSGARLSSLSSTFLILIRCIDFLRHRFIHSGTLFFIWGLSDTWSSHGLRLLYCKRVRSGFFARRSLRLFRSFFHQVLIRRSFDWRLFLLIRASRSHSFSPHFAIIFLPTLSSVSLIAPVVGDEHLCVCVHLQLHPLEKLNILIQFHVDKLLLILFIDHVSPQILLNLHSRQILSVVRYTVTELPHSVDFPLRLQLSGSLILSVRFLEAKPPEKVPPKIPLDLDSRKCHASIEFFAFDQLVKLDYVHVHHGPIIQISDCRVIMKNIVNYCSTSWHFFGLPTKFLIIVVDLDKRDLLFEFLPGCGIHATVSDFWKFSFRRRRVGWILLSALGMDWCRILLRKVLPQRWKHVLFTCVDVFWDACIGIIVSLPGIVDWNWRIPDLWLVFWKLILHTFHIFE